MKLYTVENFKILKCNAKNCGWVDKQYHNITYPDGHISFNVRKSEIDRFFFKNIKMAKKQLKIEVKNRINFYNSEINKIIDLLED